MCVGSAESILLSPYIFIYLIYSLRAPNEYQSVKLREWYSEISLSIIALYVYSSRSVSISFLRVKVVCDYEIGVRHILPLSSHHIPCNYRKSITPPFAWSHMSGLGDHTSSVTCILFLSRIYIDLLNFYSITDDSNTKEWIFGQTNPLNVSVGLASESIEFSEDFALYKWRIDSF